MGGLHQGGEKREKGELHPGDIRLFRLTVPERWTHAPAFEVINVGATIRRVAGSHDRRTGDLKGVSTGALAGLLGIVKEMPFVSSAARVKAALGRSAGDYERGGVGKKHPGAPGRAGHRQGHGQRDVDGWPVKNRTTVAEAVTFRGVGFDVCGFAGDERNRAGLVANVTERLGSRGSTPPPVSDDAPPPGTTHTLALKFSPTRPRALGLTDRPRRPRQRGGLRARGAGRLRPASLPEPG